MSIFDFLFARAATPEQRDKNVFVDMIDGGGRFGADDDFRGGPMGISALLNALGVNPYGSTNAQPSSPPPRTAPVGKPARQSAPRPASPLNLVDFITANNNLGLSPSTDAELTAAFDQPIPVSPTARPFDGAGFGYTFPPPAPQMGTSFGNLGNPVDMTRDLGLLAPQVVQEVTASQPVDYFSVATKYPEFFAFVKARKVSGLTYDELARQFLKIPEGTASSASASPLAMSAAPASLSSSPTYADPSPHPESEIQRFMRDYDMTRATAIQSLDATALYEREIRKGMQDAFQGSTPQ